MRKLALLLLLAFPVFGQLPPGVTRIPYPDTHFDSYFLVATPDDVLWTRSALSNSVLRIDLDGQTANVAFPFAVAGTHFSGLTVGPDGAVWVASPSRLTRVDPQTNTTQAVFVGANRDVSDVLSGPDGSLWLISPWTISRMATDGTPLSSPRFAETGFVTGRAFGTDGNLYLVTTTANGQLVRVNAAGERITFPAATRSQLFAGIGFLWSTARQYDAPARPPFADVSKLSYTGETQASYQLPMTPFASDALGNLWLRTTTEEGDLVAKLSPSGLLTKYGPIPALASTQCFPRYYGGLAFLSDGRVAMADHFPDIPRSGLSPCMGASKPADMVNTITILDPRIAPIAGFEQLGPPGRRRSSRH
jgi:hypothetical protein